MKGIPNRQKIEVRPREASQKRTLQAERMRASQTKKTPRRRRLGGSQR